MLHRLGEGDRKLPLIRVALTALALTTVSAAAQAESHVMDPMTVTCADFLAMESEPMMMAVGAIDNVMHDGMASDPVMTEEMSAEMTTACTGMEAMTAMDATAASMK